MLTSAAVLPIVGTALALMLAGTMEPLDAANVGAAHTLEEEDMSKLFESPVKTLDGKPSSLAAHKGKALLIVNVASKCGLTPQYADLEKLHDEYKGRGFAVVGFPCNQFGAQEPGSAVEIQEFCSATYGVTFPMFEKIEVNGGGRHPIYQALTTIKDADGEAGDIQWNFEKFVVSADGKTVTRFRPTTAPYDPAIVSAIEAGLP
jgi:glutathione peroxidase